MPDAQLLATGTSAAPLDYEVPGNITITPKYAFAHFDGTSAGVAWYPAVQVISDSGHTVATIPTGSSVAAGAAVDATWAPFLRSSSAAAVYQVPYAALRLQSAQSIPGTNVITYISMQDGLTGAFETSDATVFANATFTIGGSPQWCVKCLKNGTYLIRENCFVTPGTGTSGANLIFYHALQGGNIVSDYQSGRTGAHIANPWDQGQTNTHLTFSEWSNATSLNPAPIYVIPYCQLASGSSCTVRVQTMVMYLGGFAGSAL